VNPGESNIYRDLNSSFVSNASKQYEVYFYKSKLKIQGFILFPNHDFFFLSLIWTVKAGIYINP